MINGFDQETAPLTAKEEEYLLKIVPHLSKKIGKKNAITNKAMTEGIKKTWNVKISGPRMRKIINQIRIRGLVRRLVATSKGYYVENDDKKFDEYVESLDQRIEAIMAVRDAMKNQKIQIPINYGKV